MKAIKVRELLKFSPEVIRLHLKEDLVVVFEDSKQFKMTNKEIIILRYIIEVYKVLENNIIDSPVNFTLYYENNEEGRGYFSNSCILKSLTHIFYSVKDIELHYNTVCRMFYEIVNNIYNKLMFPNIEKSVTLVLKDVLEIQLQKTLMDKINYLETNKHRNSEKKNSELINDIYKEVDNATNNQNNDNTLALMYRAGIINKNQARKVLGCIGYVTDTDSEIFKTPIASSYALGMNTPHDIMVESRTGIKSSLMSSHGIAVSEYSARELQFCTMYIKSLIYNYDCGTTKGIEWVIDKDNIKELDGKYYITNEGLKVIRKNDKSLIGQKLKVRSALHCACEDQQKICITCFGELGYNIPRHANLGHFCSVNVSEPISQSILSTKHLILSAESSVDEIDPIAEKYFRISDDKSGLCVRSNKVCVIIKLDDFKGEMFIKDIEDDIKVNYSELSKIEEITLSFENEKGNITTKKFTPSKFEGYVSEFLIKHMKTNGYDIYKNNSFIIDLYGYDINLPIIKYPKLEYSFINLANKYKSLLDNPKGRTKDEMLMDVYKLLKSKFSYSISLIEVIVYSLTKDKYSFNLGRNCAEEEVMGNSKLIAKRSISSMYGWQDIIRHVFNPDMFIPNNNLDYNLDVLFNYDIKE